jgi:hypothetical protein
VAGGPYPTPPGGGEGALVPPAVTQAVDTEFVGTHTLSVQVAVRAGPGELAVQVYRSEAVPPPPAGFSLAGYLPLAPDSYGRFCDEVVFLPVKPLAADLSPALVLRDLLGLGGLTALSRLDGRGRIGQFGDPPEGVAGKPTNVLPARRGWRVPEVNVTAVGHYLPADLARVFGRDFLAGLKALKRAGRGGVVVRLRRLLQLVEEASGRAGPVVQDFFCGEEMYALRLQTRDTMLPFGQASLDSLSKTFLGLGKSETLTEADKRDMLRTFRERTADAYGYAAVDAVNTLLVHEQMQARDGQIYQALGFRSWGVPPLRATLGSQVSTLHDWTWPHERQGAPRPAARGGVGPGGPDCWGGEGPGHVQLAAPAGACPEAHETFLTEIGSRGPTSMTGAPLPGRHGDARRGDGLVPAGKGHVAVYLGVPPPAVPIHT